MTNIGDWRFERRHLLLLFLAGVASRGIVKSLLGANASLTLLLMVALYYLYTKRYSETIYDEIARQQAQAAMKLDAIHGIADSKLSAVETLAARQTHFQLDDSERMVITDRMHKYSSKMAGSHKDRRKFLVTRSKLTEADVIAMANGEAAQSIKTKKDSGETPKKARKRTEKQVEQSINDTL